MVEAAQGRDVWLTGGGELVGARRSSRGSICSTGVEQIGQFAYLTYAVSPPS